MRLVAHLSRWLEANGLEPADLTRGRGGAVCGRAAGGGPFVCAAAAQSHADPGDAHRHGSAGRSELRQRRSQITTGLWQPSSAICGASGRLAQARPRRPMPPALAASWAACPAGAEAGGPERGGCHRAPCSPRPTAVSPGSAQYFVAALRAFLRFCFLEGLVEADLAAAALAVTGRRRVALPRGISRADAQALLASLRPAPRDRAARLRGAGDSCCGWACAPARPRR